MLGACGAVLLTVLTGGAAGEPESPASTRSISGETSLLTWDVSWRDGIEYRFSREFQRLDEAGLPERFTHPYVRGRVGGSLFLDAAAFSGSDDLDSDSAVEVRRARLFTRGEVFLLLPVEYKLEFELQPERAALHDWYLAVRPRRWLNRVQVGHFDLPAGLDHLTSARDRLFMEPGLPVLALAPDVQAGVQASGAHDDRHLLWTLGVFAFGRGVGGAQEANRTDTVRRVAGRVAWRPWSGGEPDGSGWLHLGLHASYGGGTAEDVRYRARSESHLAPVVADTGPIRVDQTTQHGVEVAWAAGPWSLQAEYLGTAIRDASNRTLYFHGAYLAAGWLLTGESRSYEDGDGVLGRVVPRRPVTAPGGGSGAWEVAARLSRLDLDSDGVRGGRVHDLTLAVNWYLNRHVALRLNYVLSSLDRRSAEDVVIHVIQTRIQLVF